MDLLECDVPELEGDMSSRYTHSIVSISSRMIETPRIRYPELIGMTDDHHWEVKTPQTEALNGVDELHGCDPYSLASINTRTSVESRGQQDPAIIPRADVLKRAKR
jgi:hypothetical protein